MADARHVPSNLLTWPKLADLLPDQKLIYAYLWFNRFARSSGCYPFPATLAATELSLTPSSLMETLREFARRGLVAMDESTGEIFVLDWFRFNTFPPGPRQRVLAADLQRIESPVLRVIVEKSTPYFPREGKGRKEKKSIGDSRHVDNFSSSWDKAVALGLTPYKGESTEAFKLRISTAWENQNRCNEGQGQ